MILDAPGATAAAFGDGVVSHDTTISDTTNINNKASITNNVNLAATSGDATVASNTSGGDASTGNARASANIANISSSVFKLTGWFAVLFINIDGDWDGWLLKQTPAGDVLGVSPIASSGVAPPSVGAPNVSLGFKPKDNAALQSLITNGNPNSNDPYTTAVLASTMTGSGHSTLTQPILTPMASPREDPFSLIMMVTGFTIAGGSGVLWIVRRWLEYRSTAAI